MLTYLNILFYGRSSLNTKENMAKRAFFAEQVLFLMALSILTVSRQNQNKSVAFLLKRNEIFCCIILNKCVFNGPILAVPRRNVSLHGRWSPVLVGLCVLLQSHLSNQMSSSETIQAKNYFDMTT